MPPSFKAVLPPEPEQPTSIEHRVITMVIIISWFFIILTPWLNVLLFQRLHLARWCNGSTADSGSVCHGSNPCRAPTRHLRFQIDDLRFASASGHLQRSEERRVGKEC